MDNKYIKEISGFMAEFMSEQGYKKIDGESVCFENDSKCYKIEYVGNTFTLSVAPAGAQEDAFSTLSTWYFNEADHGAKDTACIAEDFTKFVTADSGIKVAKSQGAEVALPSKAVEGTEPGIEALAQKFLALFPQYKDTYKESVAKYGDFLYVDFFKRYGVEKMNELLTDEQKNKKQLKKYFDMLGDMHYNGDGIVADIICAVIIAGSFKGDSVAYGKIADKYLTDYPFLKSSGDAAVKNYKSDKKLQKALEF